MVRGAAVADSGKAEPESTWRNGVAGGAGAAAGARRRMTSGRGERGGAGAVADQAAARAGGGGGLPGAAGGWGARQPGAGGEIGARLTLGERPRLREGLARVRQADEVERRDAVNALVRAVQAGVGFPAPAAHDESKCPFRRI